MGKTFFANMCFFCIEESKFIFKMWIFVLKLTFSLVPNCDIIP